MQGKYLSEESGIWTHSDGLDFSACGDLTCILDVVYGRNDASSSALKTYWWYLRMGYVISTTSRFPGNPTGLPTDHHEFQFKPDELDAFLRLSWALPDRMRYMPTLQSIHRFPGTYYDTDWGGPNSCYENPLGGGSCTCATATGYTQGTGYIRMGSKCLALSTR